MALNNPAGRVLQRASPVGENHSEISNDVVEAKWAEGHRVKSGAELFALVTSRRSTALGKSQPNAESNQQGACAPVLNSCPCRTAGNPSSKGAPCERDCQIGWNVCDLKQ